jgi:hypothetical protein
MSKAWIVLPVACLALGACTAVDRGFGETVRWNNAAQTVNPEPPAPAEGAPIEGGYGKKAQAAVDRYEKGAVKEPVIQDTKSSSSSGSSR